MPANVAPALLTVAVVVASYTLVPAAKPLTPVMLALAISPVPVPMLLARV